MHARQRVANDGASLVATGQNVKSARGHDKTQEYVAAEPKSQSQRFQESQKERHKRTHSLAFFPPKRQITSSAQNSGCALRPVGNSGRMKKRVKNGQKMVGDKGFEPLTSRV